MDSFLNNKLNFNLIRNFFFILGVGNYSRAAEFNFYADPEAAHIVLTKSKCPITILPWEPCMAEKFFICIVSVLSLLQLADNNKKI